MTKYNSKKRIKFAYYLKDWVYDISATASLKQNAKRIIPSDYIQEMDGHLFCPSCYTNLNKIPKDKEHFKNGRESYFAHIPKFKDVKCNLKVSQPDGKKYLNSEEAKQAIDDGELVIVNGFIQTKPESPEDGCKEYDATPVEDLDGPITEVPISRYNGESFKLPSKIKTIAGLCSKFDENLYKYYHMPNNPYAVQLIDLLKNVETVTEETDEPRFYFGQIVKTKHLGEFKKPTNIRMTYLKHPEESIADFCIKTQDKDQKSHGITDDSVGRIVIIYSNVKSNGAGLCFEDLGWGEYSLLPDKYNYLLKDL